MDYVLAGCLAAWLFVVPASAAVPEGDPAVPLGPVKLDVRFEAGRSSFHLGEIIQIELTFSSAEHKAYRYNPGASPTFPEDYHFELNDPGSREVEWAATGTIYLGRGGGGNTADLAEKPFRLHDKLNRLFLFRKPGRYRFSITSRQFGFPVQSNTVELEILRSDPDWERAELARGVALLASPAGTPGHEQGCEVVGWLRTSDAHREMASLYAKRRECADTFEVGLINAGEREDILARLEAGLRDPECAVDQGLLKTLAFVSLYRQHPEWYPAEAASTLPGSAFPHIPPGEVAAEQIRYAGRLLSMLADKKEQARAGSLYSLLYLPDAVGMRATTAQIRAAVRAQLPALLDKLSYIEQKGVLSSKWPQLRGPAMVPVLKKMAETTPNSAGPLDIVLRRLFELSPAEARPYMLREMHSDHSDVSVGTLSLLPEEELPELDEFLVARIRSRFQYGDSGLLTATGLLQRYATPAVAGSLRPLLFHDGIGKMGCGSGANLIAYFLRVAPPDGAAMLAQERVAGRRPGCLILKRTAEVRMTREVEVEALAALKSSDVETVREALDVLRYYGSPQAKGAVLSAFRDWNQTWVSRETELASSEKNPREFLDSDYLVAAGMAQGWYSPPAELEGLRDLCLTARCRELGAGTIAALASSGLMIQVSEPAYNDITERVGLAPYWGLIRTMDRLKAKLLQLPKGTLVRLDTRFADSATLDRVYQELQPWAARCGIALREYRE